MWQLTNKDEIPLKQQSQKKQFRLKHIFSKPMGIIRSTMRSDAKRHVVKAQCAFHMFRDLPHTWNRIDPVRINGPNDSWLGLPVFGKGE
jgi:hypothetical protein